MTSEFINFSREFYPRGDTSDQFQKYKHSLRLQTQIFASG